jgi:hypothetical protein
VAQGSQPLSLDVLIQDRYEERDELVELLCRLGARPQVAALALERHATRTHRWEQISECVHIGMSWFRPLTTDGNRRTREQERGYAATYGTDGSPLAAD